MFDLGWYWKRKKGLGIVIDLRLIVRIHGMISAQVYGQILVEFVLWLLVSGCQSSIR